mgnify:FL=1
MNQTNPSLSLTPPSEMGNLERLGLTIAGVGLLALVVAFLGNAGNPVLPFGLGLTFFVAGGMLYLRDREFYQTAIIGAIVLGIISMIFIVARIDLAKFKIFGLTIPPLVFTILILGLTTVGAIIYYYQRFGKGPAGIRNDGYYHSEATKKNGTIGWLLAIVITGFYILVYWYPVHLHGLIVAVDPLAEALTGKSMYKGDRYSQWFLYGLFYTVAVLIMGARFMFKYRHNRYQLIRTISVTFVQLVLAFLLPNILSGLNGDGYGVFEHYFSYFWPLDWDALFPVSYTHLTLPTKDGV